VQKHAGSGRTIPADAYPGHASAEGYTRFMEPSPRSTSSIVEERILRWMEEERLRNAPQEAPDRPRPIVTISREAGARGTELALLVAQRLHFKLWDQELVQQIAGQSASPEQLQRVVDEHVRNALEDALASILLGDTFSREGYVSRLLGLIQAIAARGSAVVVGRGAQFVIEPGNALRVRVIAGLESRVRALMEARHMTDRQARAEVEHIDRERRAFVRHHFKRDAQEPTAYDLTVNSDSMSLERTAELVAFAYESKFGTR
jgi:hypothetical protein